MSVTVVEGDLPASLVRLLVSAEKIGVDTETSGLDWARDRLELCQLFSPATGAVLVRNVVDFPHRLAGLLGDESVIKVFHYAPFDLRFLEAQWSIRARRVECTKAASRVLDPHLPAAEHSLKPLLHRHLGVTISKDAIRTSDWGAASLSQEQLDYAAADVRHLEALSDSLRSRLEAANLHDLFVEVCAYLPTDAHLEVTGIRATFNDSEPRRPLRRHMIVAAHGTCRAIATCVATTYAQSSPCSTPLAGITVSLWSQCLGVPGSISH